MRHVEVSCRDHIAEVTVARGKVNALDERLVEELSNAFGRLAAEQAVRGAVLTGRGKFFSFGFDVPELMDYSRERFAEYIIKFTSLYRALFTFPKPLVAALNGHAIAGGCMLALACDRRLMVADAAKISLNEVTFGSTVFAGAVEILRSVVGARRAQEILLGGALLAPHEALAVGLVDRILPRDQLARAALAEVAALAERDLTAFASLKGLLRAATLEALDARERASIHEFVEIWYSADTHAKLANVRIRA